MKKQLTLWDIFLCQIMKLHDEPLLQIKDRTGFGRSGFCLRCGKQIRLDPQTGKWS